MNKTELLKRIEDMGEYEAFVDEPISKSAVRHLINQLDEPQKVVIPKSMAEWIEEYKQSNNSLIEAMDLLYESHFPEDCEWLTNNSEIFARAWLDGYTIEQEKLYTVEILGATLYKAVSDNHIRYHMVDYRNLTNSEDPYTYTSKLTEKEIKAADERLWKFAMEVE